MKATTRSRSGFTLLELLIVITVIALLSAALYSTFGYFKRQARIALARNTMNNISIAIHQFRADFGTFPPDDKPGSEMIAYYLTRVIRPQVAATSGTAGGPSESTFGPYLKVPDSQLVDESGAQASPSSTGTKRFLSPLGGEYAYSVQLDANGKQFSFVLVDPGLDKELGGSVSPTGGFTIDDQKKAADNIYNEAQITSP